MKRKVTFSIDLEVDEELIKRAKKEESKKKSPLVNRILKKEFKIK